MSVPIKRTLTFWEACLPSNHQFRLEDRYQFQQVLSIISILYTRLEVRVRKKCAVLQLLIVVVFGNDLESVWNEAWTECGVNCHHPFIGTVLSHVYFRLALMSDPFTIVIIREVLIYCMVILEAVVCGVVELFCTERCF